jgi:hypothetical protein
MSNTELHNFIIPRRRSAFVSAGAPEFRSAAPLWQRSNAVNLSFLAPLAKRTRAKPGT